MKIKVLYLVYSITNVFMVSLFFFVFFSVLLSIFTLTFNRDYSGETNQLVRIFLTDYN